MPLQKKEAKAKVQPTATHPADTTLNMPFSLNKRLEAGGIDFGRHGKCRILLKNNAVFPWFILVPEVEDHIVDLHQLETKEFETVMRTVREVSLFTQHHFKSDKINVAAIGNIVTQLHIHVVARYRTDPAWPDVIWGHDEKRAYQEDDIEVIQKAYHQYPF
jgi:diadenosine tetraphosphate (Ap4A) HIT family hydrolase